MIQEFVNKFTAAEKELLKTFTTDERLEYVDIVREIIKVINPNNEYGEPSSERIHTINDGDYQGTLLFIIGSSDYQPSDYWYAKVSYGSCSHCDILEHIQDLPSKQQPRQYMTLALHIVQSLKSLQEEE